MVMEYQLSHPMPGETRQQQELQTKIASAQRKLPKNNPVVMFWDAGEIAGLMGIGTSDNSDSSAAGGQLP
jgi:hypothetical protein